MAEKIDLKKNAFTLTVSLDTKSEFKGDVAAFLFDKAGNLLEQAPVKNGKAVFSRTAQVVTSNRLFIGPAPDKVEGAEKPSIRMMARVNAYETVLKRGGKILDTTVISGNIMKPWLTCCHCWVNGRVVKNDNGLPVCNARVHICEVDKFLRVILNLPDLDIIRFRDELIKVIQNPIGPWPPIPDPGPGPDPFEAMKGGLIRLKSLNPQPEPPKASGLSRATIGNVATALNTKLTAFENSAPVQLLQKLNSSPTVFALRDTLTANAVQIYPYLCYLPWVPWKYRYDEIMVITTDSLGRFSGHFYYSCNDKPDLYFWVEYQIGGVMEPVYQPPVACHTYWNFSCGSEVVIRINNERVPACNNGPDLPGSIVQILSIGNGISMSEIAADGLTTDAQPFGGKLEPRVWFSRTNLRNVKNIHYYRWSFRRLTQGDGTPLLAIPEWTHMTRAVVRHYAAVVPGAPGHPDVIVHLPEPMGPYTVGGQADLFSIRPMEVPAGGIEWSVVDEHEDLASAHFETDKLGKGDTFCKRALDAAGKFEIRLELFKSTGALVDWTAEGIDLQITNVPAPFGTNAVIAVSAPDSYRIKNSSNHTIAFRLVLRIDNNCCQASIDPVTGTGLNVTPCGFIEYNAGASVTPGFKAYHPNGFATFNFNVVRGGSIAIPEASTNGKTSTLSVNTQDSPPSHAYTKPSVTASYRATFSVSDLLGDCWRAAFSEALSVHTMATNGYGLLDYLDAYAHDAFALTPKATP
ncbi:MAG: hypothetical protein HGA97_00020 [Chlorobiaceae bacterium]|nr:hypothetical protein [Chlorobiaceae bacterium]